MGLKRNKKLRFAGSQSLRVAGPRGLSQITIFRGGPGEGVGVGTASSLRKPSNAPQGQRIGGYGSSLGF